MSTPVQDWIAVAEVANGYYRAMYAGEEGMLRELFDPRAPVVSSNARLPREAPTARPNRASTA